MGWIKNRLNEPIPKELFYDGCQTDKGYVNQTVLMMWIKYRLNEPIPEELYYDGY